MGRNMQLREKVLSVTEGVCESLVDLALMSVFFGIELGLRSRSPQSVHQAGKAAEDHLSDFNYQAIKKSIYRAREKGWIRPGELKLTDEGKKRIQDRLHLEKKIPQWDGKWYIVLFDVPEKQRSKRNAFRGFLKRLDFGKLFESAWISSFSVLGEVDKFIRENNLNSNVILSISDKVGIEGSRELADRVWNLSEINKDYKSFLFAKEPSFSKRIFHYLSIVKKDPHLPKELLPIDWKGHQAFEYYQILQEQLKKSVPYL